MFHDVWQSCTTRCTQAVGCAKSLKSARTRSRRHNDSALSHSIEGDPERESFCEYTTSMAHECSKTDFCAQRISGTGKREKTPLNRHTPRMTLSVPIEWRLLSLTRSRDTLRTKIRHEPYTSSTHRTSLHLSVSPGVARCNHAMGHGSSGLRNPQAPTARVPRTSTCTCTTCTAPPPALDPPQAKPPPTTSSPHLFAPVRLLYSLATTISPHSFSITLLVHYAP